MLLDNEVYHIIGTMWIGIRTLAIQHLFAILRIFAKAHSHSDLLMNISREIRHTVLMKEMRIVIF